MEEAVENKDHRALLERLERLVKQHSQAEIARRTGTPVSGMHRYLNGARIPGHLLAAISREFGVSPLWLLLGEGPQHVSDLSTGAAETASNMSEIVQGMNAVMRFKLGALSGNERQQALRKLGEGLEVHRKLRDDLAAVARPMLAGVVEEYRTAINNADLSKAKKLRREGKQLVPIANDDELEIYLDRLCASQDYLEGDRASAVAIYREIFRRSFAAGSAPDAALLNEVFDFAIVIEGAGLRFEALNTCRAMLLLYRDLDSLPEYAQLRFVAGHLMVGVGRGRCGLPHLLKGHAGMTPAQRELYAHVRRGDEILTGALDYAEAIELDRKNLRAMLNDRALAYAASMLSLCLWYEFDPALVENAANIYLDNPLRLAECGSPMIPYTVRALVDVRRHGAAAVDEFFHEPAVAAQSAAKDEGARFYYHTCACMVRRVSGATHQAVEELRLADAHERERPRGVMWHILHRSHHYRNALLLAGQAAVSEELVARAQRFFRRCWRHGVFLFRQDPRLVDLVSR